MKIHRCTAQPVLQNLDLPVSGVDLVPAFSIGRRIYMRIRGNCNTNRIQTCRSALLTSARRLPAAHPPSIYKRHIPPAAVSPNSPEAPNDHSGIILTDEILLECERTDNTEQSKHARMPHGMQNAYACDGCAYYLPYLLLLCPCTAMHETYLTRISY